MEILSAEEIRLIGSLIEKENTTPEYYPMTANSLMNACNQKSSRNPVVSYDESIIENTISSLRDKKLVLKVTGGDFRVPKYRQSFTEFHKLTKPQMAVICVLFLRGPQTIGEIRGRSARIYEFENLGETENTISEMMERDEEAFIVKLPKDSGREHRFMHLFGGEPDVELFQTKPSVHGDKFSEMENEITELKELYNSLKSEFEEFKKQFE